MSLTPNWPKSPVPSAFDELYEQRQAMITTSPDWADEKASALAHPILGVVRQGIKSKADGVIPSDNGPMVSFEEWGARLIAGALREAYERGATEMRERAAHKATGFLVGDPIRGVPLRNPMGHEIADAIRALPVEK